MAAPNFNPQFQSVGDAFTQQYYQTFDSNRPGLAPLYGDTSLLSFEGEQFQGAANIVNKIANLPFRTVRHQIVKHDIHPTCNGGVLIAVTGNLFVDDSQNPLKFAQTFVLMPTPQGGWFCQNDMFRLNIG